MKPYLKPCPFCGGSVEAMYFDVETQEDYAYEDDTDADKALFFRCWDCDFEFIPPTDTAPEDVFAMFNERKES